MAWIGMDAMRAKLERLKRGLPSEIARALYVETEVEVTEVKRRTPVRYGELVNSVHQVGPTIERGVISSLIVAGGPAAPYAIYVHEDLTAFHKVGQAKFIESVLMESRAYMAGRIAKRIELNRAMA